MSNERLKEIKNIMLTPHLDMYLSNACNELFQYVIKQKEILDNIKNNNKRIIDYGFDYDGFNNVEDLKKLIDMLVDYARKNYELLEETE